MFTRDDLPVTLLAMLRLERVGHILTHQKAAPIWLPCGLLVLLVTVSSTVTYTLAGLKVNLVVC